MMRLLRNRRRLRLSYEDIREIGRDTILRKTHNDVR